MKPFKILSTAGLSILLMLATHRVSFSQSTQSFHNVVVKNQLQLKTLKVTDFKTSFGPDSTSDTKIATIKAVRDWVNLSRFGMMAYIETRVAGLSSGGGSGSGGNPNYGWGLIFLNDTLRVDPSILTGGGSHTGTPTVSVSSGAGTGPSGVNINGNDLRGEIYITTGTAPAASSVVVTVNFAEPFSSYPFVQVSGADAPTSSKIPYSPNVSPSFFRIMPTYTLEANTSYKFTYRVNP